MVCGLNPGMGRNLNWIEELAKIKCSKLMLMYLIDVLYRAPNFLDAAVPAIL